MAKRMKSCLRIAGVLSSGLLLIGCASTGKDRRLVDLVATQRQAELAYAKADWPQALTDYQLLTKAAPKQAEYWFRLGNVQFRQGQPDAATQSYLQALQIDPKLSGAWYNLGIVRLREAEAAFVQGAQLGKPSDPVQQRSIDMVDGIAHLTNAKDGQADAPPSARSIAAPASGGGS